MLSEIVSSCSSGRHAENCAETEIAPCALVSPRPALSQCNPVRLFSYLSALQAGSCCRRGERVNSHFNWWLKSMQWREKVEPVNSRTTAPPVYCSPGKKNKLDCLCIGRKLSVFAPTRISSSAAAAFSWTWENGGYCEAGANRQQSSSIWTGLPIQNVYWPLAVLPTPSSSIILQPEEESFL